MCTASAATAGGSAPTTAANQARHALSRAEAFAGTEAVYSASLAARDELELEVEMTSIVGVEVLHIEQQRVARSAVGRGYSITSTSTLIDEAATAFEDEVEAIIQLAVIEIYSIAAIVIVSLADKNGKLGSFRITFDLVRNDETMDSTTG